MSLKLVEDNVSKDETSSDRLSHIYARPPRPGDQAYCGHMWTPEEAEAIHRGILMGPCNECNSIAR